MNIGLPQAIVVAFMTYSILSAVYKSGKSQDLRRIASINIVSVVILFALLLWGGFFA